LANIVCLFHAQQHKTLVYVVKGFKPTQYWYQELKDNSTEDFILFYMGWLAVTVYFIEHKTLV
jgi:hypothetical protein